MQHLIGHVPVKRRSRFRETAVTLWCNDGHFPVNSAQISQEGRFTSAYNAIHAAALAALRWHGYRSENRYIVFQSLGNTLDWPANKWRVLDAAHQKRNLAEYEGFLEIEESTIAELQRLANELIADVEKLVTSS